MTNRIISFALASISFFSLIYGYTQKIEAVRQKELAQQSEEKVMQLETALSDATRRAATCDELLKIAAKNAEAAKVQAVQAYKAKTTKK